MTTDEYTAPVDLPEEQVFTFVTEPGRLAEFFPAAREPRVDTATRTVSWGDGGRLAVRDAGAGSCEITVSGGGGPREVREAVAALTQAASARNDADVADQQDGWPK